MRWICRWPALRRSRRCRCRGSRDHPATGSGGADCRGRAFVLQQVQEGRTAGAGPSSFNKFRRGGLPGPGLRPSTSSGGADCRGRAYILQQVQDERIRGQAGGRSIRMKKSAPGARIGDGGMAEWTIAAVLKAAIPPGIVGSNPTPSASGMAEKGAEFVNPAPTFGRLGRNLFSRRRLWSNRPGSGSRRP